MRQQYPWYRLLAMESQHNIRQTIHYYPAENNSALRIIKIGLLQAKFCWVHGKIQNFGKFWSLVHSVKYVSHENLMILMSQRTDLAIICGDDGHFGSRCCICRRSVDEIRSAKKWFSCKVKDCISLSISQKLRCLSPSSTAFNWRYLDNSARVTPISTSSVWWP